MLFDLTVAKQLTHSIFCLTCNNPKIDSTSLALASDQELLFVYMG